MAELKHLLTGVRKDSGKMDHHRKAYSISHPYPINTSPTSLPRSPTAILDRPPTPIPLHAYDILDSDIDNDKDTDTDTATEFASPEVRQRPHTGTATCSCLRCMMPGRLSFAEYERHVNAKIEAGKRELDSIDDQLAHCRDLMKTLLQLEEHAAKVAKRAESGMPGRDGHADDGVSVTETWSVKGVRSAMKPEIDGWSASATATAPPSPDFDGTLTVSDDALAPLLEESPQSRRHTVLGLPSFTSISSLQARPRLTANGNSFNSAAASSFYSQASATSGDDEILPLPSTIAVPPRASSRQKPRMTVVPGAYDGYLGLESPISRFSSFDRQSASASVPNSPSFYDEAALARLHPGYVESKHKDGEKPLPPLQRPQIQRSYTPRTESTTELLSHFPDLDLPTNLPYASGHNRSSSIFNRRKGFIAIESSDEYASSNGNGDESASGRATPQESTNAASSRFRWHSQRTGRPSLKSKRRLSKADELLGLGDADSVSFKSSRGSSRLGMSSEGKRSVMNLLKFSALRRGKGDH